MVGVVEIVVGRELAPEVVESSTLFISQANTGCELGIASFKTVMVTESEALVETLCEVAATIELLVESDNWTLISGFCMREAITKQKMKK